MGDLTIIYYTANQLRFGFAESIRKNLLSVAGNYPVISVSQIPLALGENINVGNIGKSYLNIYKQILIGVKMAKTKYVALAEDDVLYSTEHFNCFRPKDDEVAYNTSKWSIYTWSNPAVFSYKNRDTNTTLLASKDLIVEALTERFAKFPDESKIPFEAWGEIGRYEDRLGVTKRKKVQFVSSVPCVVFSHPDAVGYKYLGDRKKLGFLKAYDIPVWGSAKGVIQNYYEQQ